MKKLIVVIVICVVVPILSAAQDTLFVYGPGGPFAARDECARAFGKQNKIVVKVVAGPEANWIIQQSKMQTSYSAEQNICLQSLQ